MNQAIPIRKLPFKTKVVFIILGFFSILIFLLIEDSNSMKASEILKTLGYKNISELKVYSKTQVEDKVTKIQGFKYFVKFKNDNKACKGFILKDFKKATKQDIDCE